eukprot:2195438-Rhodomonas_salina.1
MLPGNGRTADAAARRARSHGGGSSQSRRSEDQATSTSASKPGAEPLSRAAEPDSEPAWSIMMATRFGVLPR